MTQARAKEYWNVIVDRTGIYELELRRWPKESGKTLTEGFNGPEDTGPENAGPEGAGPEGRRSKNNQQVLNLRLARP